MRLRIWLIPLLVMMLVWPSALTHRVEAASLKEISIYLDGDLIPSDTSPYIKPKENVTMVPLRVIMEGLSAQVGWSQQSKTATINRNNTTIVLAIGNKTALVNGVPVGLDVSVEIINGRTMVPIRFVSEQLGLEVTWNQSLRTITLSSQGTSPDSNPPIPLDPDGSQQDSGESNNEELRGVWVSTVFSIDWPSTHSYGKEEVQKAEYIALLDDVQAMGMNAIFVQVRPSADAIYRSKLVPWSTYLTGTPGKDPGYDPLQFMIEETHRRGMEFHAWFNPFRASTGANAKFTANHVAKQHPDWIVHFNNMAYINPGIPEARQHIIDVILEVVDNYDIDGVHLDDYFYPTGESSSKKFNDDLTYKTYNSNQISNKADWRRDNINDLVQSLGIQIHRANPDISYGISPSGVWRNQSKDSTGSNTKASVTAYDSSYADVRQWIKNEWIDYVVPQIYWSMTRPEVRYDILANWWANEVKGTDVKLYIGHAPYKLGTNEVGWNTAQEIINQLHYNRNIPEISGSIFFSANVLRKNPLGIIQLLQSYYAVNGTQ